jgi:hypothetical protein
MDSVWALRTAYSEARKIKKEQDDFCANIEAGLWDSLNGSFPDDSQWEILVDVLRGRVKVKTYSVTAPLLAEFDAIDN